MTVEQKSPATHHIRNVLAVLAIPLLIVLSIAWKGGLLRPSAKIAIITSTPGPYWDRVLLGARDACRLFDAELVEIRNTGDEKTQSQAIDDAVAKGYNGIGVSPVNPQSQAGLLSDVANKVTLVTLDSDCPAANRRAFVGTDNYLAGRQCSLLIQEAIPDGGEVIIAVGSIDKENGRLRRQGLIDNLLERPLDAGRATDPVDPELKGAKYTIATTLVDNVDATKATQLAVDAITKHPNLKCLVGLFGYNTPALLDALKQTGKLGQIKVVGFDEAEPTLAGIEAGNVFGTLVQDQYNMGYDTARFLIESLRYPSTLQPGTQMQYLPCRAVSSVEDVKVIRYEKERESSKSPTTQPG